MNELLVMRHAKSDWSFGVADFRRPLNDRGERAAQQMATWMADENLAPDRIVSSSAVRTRSTALVVMQECKVDRALVDFEDDLYLADAFTWLQTITQQHHDRVLICGHNPGLDDLVDYLATVEPALTASGKLMTTAAVAHFRFSQPWSELGQRSAELVQLVRPRELG